MLADLHKIDWDKFYDYGCPHQTGWPIPDTIFGLASNDAKARDAATHDLFDRVFPWQPDSIPVIIPFLHELISDSPTADKGSLLGMLAFLVFGIDTFTRLVEVNRQELIEEIRCAVDEGIDRYLVCLSDNDPKIRAAAAQVTGRTRVSGVENYLVEQLAYEENADVRMSILESLGTLNASNSVNLVSKYLDDPDSKVRLQSAMTLSVFNVYCEKSIDLLIDNCFTTTPKPKANLTIRNLLQEYDYDTFRNALAKWTIRLTEIEEEQLPTYVYYLMKLVFESHECGQSPIVKTELTDEQRLVLSAILEFQLLWDMAQRDPTVSSKIRLWLEIFRLPTDRTRLATFLK